MINKLLTAIVEDDLSAVKKVLKAEPGIATETVRTAKLYQSGIFHWLYVSDTALHLAAAGYRREIIQALINAGADPNARNRRGATPLHYAADGFITGPVWDAKKQVATIGCLVGAGADIHAQDKNGATPLHRAVRTRSAATVKFLLEAGSDPLQENFSGSTPFHLAVQNTGRGGSGEKAAIEAQREIIGTFLEFEVDPRHRSSNGKSVLDSIQSDWVRELF